MRLLEDDAWDLLRDHKAHINSNDHANAMSTHATVSRVLLLDPEPSLCEPVTATMISAIAAPTRPWYLISRIISSRLLSRGFVALRLIIH
jgi:hypothetical protein